MYHKDIGSCEMYRHKTNARVQIPEGEKFMNERNVRPFSKRDMCLEIWRAVLSIYL